MKIFQSVSINRSGCPTDLYEDIARLSPKGHGNLSFHLEAKAGDDEAARLVERIVTMCEQHGLQKTCGDTSGAYVHLVMPVYEPNDLQAAPLLCLMGQRQLFYDSEQRDELGRLWLPAAKAKPNIRIASICPTAWIVVSDAVRKILEGGGFAGLLFGEVCLRGKSGSPSPAPFWELKSSVTLPKMTNSKPFTNVGYLSYSVDDPYGEPHYRHSALHALGAFDIAYTLEALASPDPRLVVSQRFYQHCLNHEIPLEVHPVRIDPD